MTEPDSSEPSVGSQELLEVLMLVVLKNGEAIRLPYEFVVDANIRDLSLMTWHDAKTNELVIDLTRTEDIDDGTEV